MSHLDPTLPLVEWATLSWSLQWAYEGPVLPAFRHLEQTGHYAHHRPSAAWHIRKGSVTVVDREGNQLTAQAGDWLLMSDYQRHDFSEDAEIISIVLLMGWPDGRPFFEHAPMVLLNDARARKLASEGRRLVAFVRRVAPQAGTLLGLQRISIDTYSQFLLLTARWMDAFVKTARKAGWRLSTGDLPDTRMAEAVQLMNMFPMNGAHSIADVARQVGLSVSQLERLFVRHYGKTPSQYMHQRRWTVAADHVKHTTKPIKEIAFELGFRQLSHFSAWFTRHAGCSPKVYRTQK